MSRICQITGIGAMTGHNISHSNRKTKRRFYPNLMKRRFFVPETKTWVTLRVSAAGVKNIDKKGIIPCLKEAYSSGILPKRVVQRLGKIFQN